MIILIASSIYFSLIFFQPHILHQTRIISNTRPSLIDNIFLNSLDFDTTSGNLISPISDHLPNFIFCHNLDVKSKAQNRGFYRNYKKFNPDSYIYDLRNSSLEQKLCMAKGTDEQYNVLHDVLIENINKHAPLTQISRKMQKQKQKPWITKGILKSISIKNVYYKKFLKTKDLKHYKNYKYYRDMINYVIRKSKRKHYVTYFDIFKNNSKKLWSAVKEIINPQTNKNKI